MPDDVSAPDGQQPAPEPQTNTMPPAVATPETGNVTPAEAAPAASPEVAGNAPAASPGSRLWLWVAVVIVVLLAAAAALYLTKWHKPTTAANSAAKHDIALIRFGSNNNPLNAFYPDPASLNGPFQLNEQIFEGLVTFRQGTQIVPDLAASWSNPNDTTWIFKLRPDAFFHDGNPVTAQDVLKTWQLVNGQNGQLASYTTNTIQNVQAVDNLTVKITTKAPDPILLNRLTLLWIIDSKAPAGAKPWDLASGPYTVKTGTTPTANSIDLVAFDKWPGGHIYTREVDYTFYSDPSAALTDLKAGKLDLVDSLSLKGAASLPQSQFKALTRNQLNIAAMVFNTTTKNSPTSNSDVRKALHLAIDPAAVLKASNLSGVVASQILPPEVPGYDPSIKPLATNVTEAKTLLTQAGYPNGFTLNFGFGPPAAAREAEIAKELKAIGVTVNPMEATDEGTYFSNINNGAYAAFLANGTTSLIDASDILSLWQGSPFYNNAAFNSKMDEAGQTFNASQRLKALQAANDILSQDNALVPLMQENTIIGVRNNYNMPVDFYGDGDLDVLFANVSQ